MRTAVAYARYSSDNQREESVHAQLRAIEEFCRQNNITLLRKYIDEAITGTNDDREQFQRMIEEARGINYVIVHKLDRFARNRYDSAINRKKLKDRGIQLLSVLEKFDGSPESIMLESVIEGMNEYYSANLSREVKKGHRENALNAKHNGGIPPLGYDVDTDQNYIINQEEAAAVQLIFKMYAEGEGYSPIIDALKARGYKTKVGKDFGKNSLHEILRNEKYIGVYIYNRRQRSGNTYNNHKESNDVIRMEEAMPRIIDDDTWSKVLAKREENKRKGGSFRADFVYLLSGKLYHDCGKLMSGTAKKNKKSGDPVRYYRCEDRSCSIRPKSLQAESIESVVLDTLSKYLFKADSTFAKEIYKRSNEKSDVEELERLTKRMDQLLKEEERLVNLALKDFLSDILIQKNKALQEEKSVIKARMASLKSSAKSYSMEEINRIFLTYSELNRFEPPSQKKIIELFVYKVILYESRIRILLYPNPFDKDRAYDIGSAHPDQ